MLPISSLIRWVSITLQSSSSSFHQGGYSGLESWIESSISSLLLLTGETERVSKMDLPESLRCLGVEGAAGGAAGGVEAGGAPAWAAW